MDKKFLKKKIILSLRRAYNKWFKSFGFKASIALLLFSMCCSLVVLVPTVLHRVPVFSYFIDEMRLPVSYTLEGKISICDAEKNIVCKDVEVIIGGYSTFSDVDGYFSLKFASPNSTDIPVVIKYTKPNTNQETHLEFITFNRGDYILQKEFVINA